jgi:tetratricopeptide (TPR) repeat protein
MQDASNSHKKALALSKSPYEIARCGILLSAIYFEEKKEKEAASILLASLPALRDFGDYITLGVGLEILSSIRFNEGLLADAILYQKEAIDGYKYIGADLKVAFCQQRIGDITKDDEEAVQFYQLAIPQFWASNFTFAGAECRFDLGLRYKKMRRLLEALENLEIALPQLQANGTTDLASDCLVQIIKCLCAIGNIRAAKTMLQSNEDAIRVHFTKVRKASNNGAGLVFSIKKGGIHVSEKSNS